MATTDSSLCLLLGNFLEDLHLKKGLEMREVERISFLGREKKIDRGLGEGEMRAWPGSWEKFSYI